MTQTHVDFLSTAGAIVIVICSTDNVINNNTRAFEQQAKFARDIMRNVNENNSLRDVPVVVLLISNGAGRQLHEGGLNDVPALVTCNNYTTSALANAVRVLFGN